MPIVKLKNDALIKPTEGQAECLMEVNSRRVLYQNSADVRLPMASTTKILTCLTVLNICKNLQEEVIIPKEAEGVEGSSVYLKAGDKYTVEALLYGLMLRSGNDCAVALALHCSGDIARFCAQMNKFAQSAGALNSRFENPHGLPCKNHYTTAYDLTLISCLAMQNSIFKRIVSTQYYAPYGWKNKNKMLTLYEGGVGIKTGYTKQAGRCLVSAAERNGMTVVCTLLNCPTTYERTSELLDDAYGAYSYEKILDKDAPLTIKTPSQTLTGHSKQDIYYPLLADEKSLISIQTKPKRLLKKQEFIGEFSIYLAKQLLFSGNLYKL